jgi:hypothetical protein
MARLRVLNRGRWVIETALDDVSHLEGDTKKVSKLVTFRLAGNQTKERAGQYVVAHNLVEEDFRVISLSTSEDPLWEQLDRYGPRRIRGEEVRMVDVPACVSDMQDIFDGEHAHAKVGETVEQRRRFVEDQERLARKYQGVSATAGRCQPTTGTIRCCSFSSRAIA